MSLFFDRTNVRQMISEEQQVEFSRLLSGSKLVREILFFGTHLQGQLTIVFVAADEEFCRLFPAHAEELVTSGEFIELSCEELRLEAWISVMPHFRNWLQDMKVPGARKSVIADVMFVPVDWKSRAAQLSEDYYCSVPYMVEDMAKSFPLLTIKLHG